MPTPTKDEIVKYELAQRAIKIYTKLISYPEWKQFEEVIAEKIREFNREWDDVKDDVTLRMLQGKKQAAQDLISLPKYEIRDAKEFVVMFDKTYKKQKKEA